MTAGGALIDARRQRAHGRDAIGNLLPEQHSAATRLGALSDDDLDGIGAPDLIGLHAIARGKILIDEQARRRALFFRHAAIAGRRRRADSRRAAPQRFLRRARERTEAHTCDRDRDLELDGLLREARAEHDVRAALLAISFERIAADRGAEKQQIIEVRQFPLRAEATNVIDTRRSGAVNFRDSRTVECRGLAWRRVDPTVVVGHQ